MQIRVGTGSHGRRHSDVRCCAHSRRANRPFDPLTPLPDAQPSCTAQAGCCEPPDLLGLQKRSGGNRLPSKDH